ncbi:MAG: hypothetical protein SFU91_06295 [Chloroherpetonaceae bacterium]|nr:hypothetical protein [Chloroherpetonaceae bacterium]
MTSSGFVGSDAVVSTSSTTFYIVPFLVISNEAKRSEKSLVCGVSEIFRCELDEQTNASK